MLHVVGVIVCFRPEATRCGLVATKVVARQYLARHGTPTTPERLTEHQWLALDVTAAGNLARETNPPSGTIGPLPPGRGEYRNSSNVSTSASMPLALQSAEGQRREMRISARIVSNNQVALQRMCELGLGIARLARVDVLQSLHRRALVQVLDGWWQEPLPIWAVTPN